jgi:hypothetical protein
MIETLRFRGVRSQRKIDASGDIAFCLCLYGESSLWWICREIQIA